MALARPVCFVSASHDRRRRRDLSHDAWAWGLGSIAVYGTSLVDITEELLPLMLLWSCHCSRSAVAVAFVVPPLLWQALRVFLYCILPSVNSRWGLSLLPAVAAVLIRTLWSASASSAQGSGAVRIANVISIGDSEAIIVRNQFHFDCCSCCWWFFCHRSS